MTFSQLLIFLTFSGAMISCLGAHEVKPDKNQQAQVPATVDVRRPLLFGEVKGRISNAENERGLEDVKVIYNVFILGSDGTFQDDVLITSSLPDERFTTTNSSGNFSFNYRTNFLTPGQEQVQLMIDLQCEKEDFYTLNPLFFEYIYNPLKEDTIAAPVINYPLSMKLK